VLRVVLDPGVLVSAVLGSTGAPAEVLDRWRDGEFDMIVSPALLGELEKVLSRPKFHQAAREEEVRAYVDALAREGVLVLDPEQIPAVTPDPTELPDPPVPVLTPRELLGRLERE
jgi:putative PIN family toxin of toxin-antitoxin system